MAKQRSNVGQTDPAALAAPRLKDPEIALAPIVAAMPGYMHL